MLIEDGFESLAEDGELLNNLPLPWVEMGGSDLKYGTFNPQGRGRWYERSELADDSQTSGLIKGMKGPRLGFIFTNGKNGGAVERIVTKIESGCVYNIGLSLGVRTTRHKFGGYEIALMSGSEVLASKSSLSPPTVPNEFIRISLSWDSNKMPPEVKYGDDLKIRITSLGIGKSSQEVYLDFDRLQVSKMAYSKE